MSLSSIFDLLQKVFVERYFCSKENVSKVSGFPIEQPVITPSEAIQPMDRCSICTLTPPCKHITIEQMTTLGIARRKELPRYKDGSMNCPEFIRYGHCSIFNKYGHCSLGFNIFINIIVMIPIIRSSEEPSQSCCLTFPMSYLYYSLAM